MRQVTFGERCVLDGAEWNADARPGRTRHVMASVRHAYPEEIEAPRQPVESTTSLLSSNNGDRYARGKMR